MFSVRQQIRGNYETICVLVCRDENFGGSCWEADSNPAKQLSLGLRTSKLPGPAMKSVLGIQHQWPSQQWLVCRQE
jgi:hypothetical protein